MDAVHFCYTYLFHVSVRRIRYTFLFSVSDTTCNMTCVLYMSMVSIGGARLLDVYCVSVTRACFTYLVFFTRTRCTRSLYLSIYDANADTHFTHENVQHRLRVPRGRAGSKRPLSLLQFALSIPTTLFAWSLSHLMRVIRICSAHPLLASLTRFQCTYPVILSI